MMMHMHGCFKSSPDVRHDVKKYFETGKNFTLLLTDMVEWFHYYSNYYCCNSSSKCKVFDHGKLKESGRPKIAMWLQTPEMIISVESGTDRQNRKPKLKESVQLVLAIMLPSKPKIFRA